MGNCRDLRDIAAFNRLVGIDDVEVDIDYSSRVFRRRRKTVGLEGALGRCNVSIGSVDTTSSKTLRQ